MQITHYHAGLVHDQLLQRTLAAGLKQGKHILEELGGIQLFNAQPQPLLLPSVPDQKGDGGPHQHRYRQHR